MQFTVIVLMKLKNVAETQPDNTLQEEKSASRLKRRTCRLRQQLNNVTVKRDKHGFDEVTAMGDLQLWNNLQLFSLSISLAPVEHMFKLRKSISLRASNKNAKIRIRKLIF